MRLPTAAKKTFRRFRLAPPAVPRHRENIEGIVVNRFAALREHARSDRSAARF
jgi:hypothetical protein